MASVQLVRVLNGHARHTVLSVCVRGKKDRVSLGALPYLPLGMEKAYVMLYSYADQKIPDRLHCWRKVETAARLGTKPQFGDLA